MVLIINMDKLCAFFINADIPHFLLKTKKLRHLSDLDFYEIFDNEHQSFHCIPYQTLIVFVPLEYYNYNNRNFIIFKLLF